MFGEHSSRAFTVEQSWRWTVRETQPRSGALSCLTPFLELQKLPTEDITSPDSYSRERKEQPLHLSPYSDLIILWERKPAGLVLEVTVICYSTLKAKCASKGFAELQQDPVKPCKSTSFWERQFPMQTAITTAGSSCFCTNLSAGGLSRALKLHLWGFKALNDG